MISDEVGQKVGNPSYRICSLFAKGSQISNHVLDRLSISERKTGYVHTQKYGQPSPA